MLLTLDDRKSWSIAREPMGTWLGEAWNMSTTRLHQSDI
jgi:hypothetical protein